MLVFTFLLLSSVIFTVKCINCHDRTFATTIEITTLGNQYTRKMLVQCISASIIQTDVSKIKFNDQLTDVYENLVTGLPALNTLDLIQINVQTLHPGAFKNLQKLHSIYLNSNKILNIPNGIFSPIPSLLRLDLQQNQIMNIESDAFKNLNKLFYLNLTDNHLESIPQNVFHKLSQLRYLSLRQNRLLTLGKFMFADNIILYELLLSHNRLESLDEDVFQWTGTRETREMRVHLTDNNLSYLPMKLLKHFPKYEFDLRYNPWTCDCANELLRAVGTSGTVHLVIDEEPYCVASSTGVGKCEKTIDKEVISYYDGRYRKSHMNLISQTNLASY